MLSKNISIDIRSGTINRDLDRNVLELVKSERLKKLEFNIKNSLIFGVCGLEGDLCVGLAFKDRGSSAGLHDPLLVVDRAEVVISLAISNVKSVDVIKVSCLGKSEGNSVSIS